MRDTCWRERLLYIHTQHIYTHPYIYVHLERASTRELNRRREFRENNFNVHTHTHIYTYVDRAHGRIGHVRLVFEKTNSIHTHYIHIHTHMKTTCIHTHYICIHTHPNGNSTHAHEPTRRATLWRERLLNTHARHMYTHKFIRKKHANSRVG